MKNLSRASVRITSKTMPKSQVYRLRRIHIFLAVFLAMNAISAISFGMSDIDKAKTMFQGIGERDVALATKYIDPLKFKNHSPMAYDGIEGVKGFISHLPKEKSQLTIVRAFQDGQYVFTQAEGDLFGKKVFFDIFKFEDGKIVEHWDNQADFTAPNQSGHTPTDGPTKAVDLQKTDQNKELIKGFYTDIFLNGQFQKMSSYFNGDNFIRHDARGGDGLSALGALMQEQAKKGIVMKVDKINMLLGQGNFVLVAATGSIANQPVVYYDLFRVENSKIAEHWDVIENIPPADQWRNQNGKF